MAGIIDLLRQLSSAGQELQAVSETEDTSAKLAIVQGVALGDSHLKEARKLASDGTGDLWSRLQQDKIVLADVARAFAAVMSLAPEGQALQAAVVYTSLLKSQGCPVLSLFDRVVCGSFLKLLRDLTTSQKPKSKKGGKAKPGRDAAAANDDAMDVDDPFFCAATPATTTTQSSSTTDPAIIGPLLTQCAENFAGVLSSLALRDQPETSRQVAEAFADIAALPGVQQNTLDAAYSVILALLSPNHGNIREISAMVFRLLTPHLLGAGGSTAKASSKETRTAALAFVRRALEVQPGCEEAAAALMRHAVLRAPDKADGRAAAVEAAVELCRTLGPNHLFSFVGFVARLSRTSKVSQRVMAVDLAPALLDSDFLSPYESPTPFAESAAAGAMGGGKMPLVPPAVAALRRASGVSTLSSLTPGSNPTAVGDHHHRPGSLGGISGRSPSAPWVGISADGQALTAAPWGAVLLAVLVQRSGDKAAAVRSRALQHLAALVAARVDDDTDNETTAALSAAFRAALAAAHKVDLQTRANCDGSPSKLSELAAGTSPAPSDGSGAPSPMTVDENITPGGGQGGVPIPGSNRTSMGGTAASKRSSGASTPFAVSPAPLFTVPAAIFGAGQSADLRPLLRTACRRCRDSKGNVRKASVQLLQALIALRASGSRPALPSPQDLAALETAAGDPLVTVRKAALMAIVSLLRVVPTEAGIESLWVEACLPMVRDSEASVLDAVLDQFSEMVLDKAAVAGGGREPGAAALAAAAELRPMMGAIARGGAACRACVGRACAQLKTKGTLQPAKAAAGLERLVSGLGRVENGDGDEDAGAWIIYAEIAAHAPTAPSWQFLDAKWAALGGAGGGGASSSSAGGVSGAAKKDGASHAAQLLRVIATAAAGFPQDRAAALCAQLRSGLEGLALPPAAAAAHVAALAQLTQTHGGRMQEWTAAALGACETALSGCIDAARHSTAAQTEDSSAENDRAAAALFAAGEVALLRAAKPSSRLVTLVQALTSPALAIDVASLSQLSSQQQPPADTVADDGSGSAPPPPAAAVPTSAAVPTAVQAHAWVALGKLCLADEPLAKKCVPLFVQELGRASSPAVRNNIMVALADLVINYTALVDSHIPRLAACIRDPNELVRTQALGLLANLLQKDYVKWRGPLFHRFLLALIDESPRVSGMAEYLLGDALATKLPNLAYNHFVEVLFVLNDCQVGLAGGAAAAAAMADLSQGAGAFAARDAFTLKGGDQATRDKRDSIYKAMLRRMAPEHKFATAARLCQEVLGGAADGALPLTECSEVVGDALRILSCKEIKVSASARAADDSEEVDAAAAVGAAKGRLVSQMMKKHLAEAVVPVIIELKRAMEAARHPLLGALMTAAAAMLKDHKAEIEDILAADRQLAKEILYDIRQAEISEATRAAEAAEAAVEAQRVRATAASKTPAAALRGASTSTPWSSGGGGGGVGNKRPRSSSRPAGTTGTTPIAAEVLRTARKPPSFAGGRSSMGSMGAPTPGSNVAAGTPGTAGATALPLSIAGRPHPQQPQQQQRTAISRLARASGPTGTTPGVAPAVPRSANGTAGTVHGTAGASPMGTVPPRLRAQSQGCSTPGTTPRPSPLSGGTATASANAVKSAAGIQTATRPVPASPLEKLLAEEEAGEPHVELNFVVPTKGGDIGAESPKMWNVSPAVVPVVTSNVDDGGNEEQEEEGGSKEPVIEEEVAVVAGGRRRQTSARAAAAAKEVAADAGGRRKRKA